MYFPTTSAKLLRPSAASTPHDLPPLPSSLADIARLGGAHDEVLVDMAMQASTGWQNLMNDEASSPLMVVLGSSEIGVWNVRPTVCLCKIKRSSSSLRKHGLNKIVQWVEDPTRETGYHCLIVLTTKSFIFKYVVVPAEAASTAAVYTIPENTPGIKSGQYIAGTGEYMPLPPLLMHEEGWLDFQDAEIVAYGSYKLLWQPMCSTEMSLLISTANPPCLHTVGWDAFSETGQDNRLFGGAELQRLAHLSELVWVKSPTSPVFFLQYLPSLELFIFIASDGRAYAVKDMSRIGMLSGRRDSSASQGTKGLAETSPIWDGQCFHGETAAVNARQDSEDPLNLEIPGKAVSVAFNERFSLLALGLDNGQVALFTIVLPSQAILPSHHFSLRNSLKSSAPHLDTGSVTDLAWTSDGYALAVGWSAGWAVWTTYGRLTTWAVGGDAGGAEGGEPAENFQDRFMYGIRRFLWGPGDLELFTLCENIGQGKTGNMDEQLFVIPFVKSAVTSLHTPDNTNNAFLQLDDGLLVYRGADQPDMSVINPDSDVWQHIKIPTSYISANWPVRYACISADARLIAIAGKRGFVHYNSLSGRWKLFENELQEQHLCIRGGLQWYGSTLVTATQEENDKDEVAYKIRLFARDRPLNTAYVLDEQTLPSAVVLTSLFDSSLLVYTEDNTFYHFIVSNGEEGHRLRLCGSIGFEGVIHEPRHVRGLSWMVPRSQQRLGDPSDDLNFATIIFLIEGKLVLLRPRRAIREEVKYDMQILADRVEFYWTHLTGIGTLENSLWGWDGESIRIWLNALTIDTTNGVSDHRTSLALETVEESLSIGIDFYPLSVLMDKGIIVGVDHETTYRRSLDFAIFRLVTNTHLFLHHVLRCHLTIRQVREAVVFASHYQHLVYFPHALEILLHSVLEDEVDALPSDLRKSLRNGSHSPASSIGSMSDPKLPAKEAVLPIVVDFLDHFTECLQVVVNCARKTEVTRWPYLFQFVGKPRDLFERCMSAGDLKIAASYLLVLHNLEPMEQSSKDTVRLLKAATSRDDWQLCKELSRFLFSLDHNGAILFACLKEASALPPQIANTSVTSTFFQSGHTSGHAHRRRQSSFSQHGLGTLLSEVSVPFSETNTEAAKDGNDASPGLQPSLMQDGKS